MKKEVKKAKKTSPPRVLGSSRPVDRVTKWRTSVEKQFIKRVESGKLTCEFQLNGKTFRMLKYPYKANTFKVEKLNNEVFPDHIEHDRANILHFLLSHLYGKHNLPNMWHEIFSETVQNTENYAGLKQVISII